jgi:hypothetical protein
MTEVVFALFDTRSAADAAVRDLQVARIPSAVVQKSVSDSALGQDSNAAWHRHASAWQRPLVTVAVDELHVQAVTGILTQYGPLKMEKCAAQSDRH